MGKKVSFSYENSSCYHFNFKMLFKLSLVWRNTFLEYRWLRFENVIRHNSRCQENIKDKADGVGNKVLNLPQLINQAYHMVMVQNQGLEEGARL